MREHILKEICHMAKTGGWDFNAATQHPEWSEEVYRILEVHPNIKALVASGYSANPVMTDFERYGFSGAVPKPFSLSELKKALDGVIEKT